VAHIAGPQNLSIYRNRRQGYLNALREAGLPVDEDLIAYTDMTQTEGAEAVQRWLLLPTPPDAVFAAGDYSALGAMEEVRRQGLQVPNNLAISGFSNEAFAVITTPTITTIDQRCEEMGQATVRLLLELIEANGAPFSARQVVLRPELLIRESSVRNAGAAPNSRTRRSKAGAR
jgi:LacI family transcriptional regulator